jgi:hypothetical protein
MQSLSPRYLDFVRRFVDGVTTRPLLVGLARLGRVKTRTTRPRDDEAPRRRSPVSRAA